MVVLPATAAGFAISANECHRGAAFGLTIIAEDAFNNTVTGYAGTVSFTSTDSAASLPANAALPFGVGVFSATLNRAGDQTLTITDTGNSITSVSAALAMSPAAGAHFTLSAPASATAGAPFTFTVTALNAGNTTASGYTGTIEFSSSDYPALLPANSTISAGIGVFTTTLMTVGTQKSVRHRRLEQQLCRKHDGHCLTQTITHFAISVSLSVSAGSEFVFDVAAEDANNHVAAGYAGTVTFTSTDSQALLPTTATLSGGLGDFVATLGTAGNQTLSIADTTTSSLSGRSTAIAVAPSMVTQFGVSAPSNVTAGNDFTITVTAEDAFDNKVTAYTGETVSLGSSDSAATFPAFGNITSGLGTFTATLRSAGNQTIDVLDSATQSLGGGTTSTVSAATASYFTLADAGIVTGGSPFAVTVSAWDVYNNIATSYTGTVHFTTGDSVGTLPSNATLTSGAGSLA